MIITSPFSHSSFSLVSFAFIIQFTLIIIPSHMRLFSDAEKELFCFVVTPQKVEWSWSL